jgi:HPt (histidine-containing phosphotransfer) domain-containing protein
MADPDALDRATLADLLREVGGDRAFLAELIQAYLADTPHRLAAMRQSLGEERAGLGAPAGAALQRAAHTLKSNSRSLGAMHLAALCQELEHVATGDGIAGAEPGVKQVEAEYARVRTALQAILEQETTSDEQ